MSSITPKENLHLADILREAYDELVKLKEQIDMGLAERAYQRVQRLHTRVGDVRVVLRGAVRRLKEQRHGAVKRRKLKGTKKNE